MGVEDDDDASRPAGGVGLSARVRRTVAVLTAGLGAGLVIAGVALAYAPAALVVAGLMVLAVLFAPDGMLP